MADKLKQLATLTAVRKLVNKDFPRVDFFYIENQLTDWIELEDSEEIEYDESRETYVLKTIPLCKVCKSTTQLREILTVNSSFHICKNCIHDISSQS